MHQQHHASTSLKTQGDITSHLQLFQSGGRLLALNCKSKKKKKSNKQTSKNISKIKLTISCEPSGLIFSHKKQKEPPLAPHSPTHALSCEHRGVLPLVQTEVRDFFGLMSWKVSIFVWKPFVMSSFPSSFFSLSLTQTI